MVHARPMHAEHALGVRESQVSVFPGSSSAEDLLASLNDFSFVVPQPYVSLDGGRVPSPLIDEKEDIIHELQPSELPTHREHVVLPDERDYRERFSPMQEGRSRILVDPSRALRTRSNVVMDHYDADTNIHTFKIAYPSHGRSEQEHYGSPEPPHAAYVSARTTPSTPSISSPLTPIYPSGSSSSSISVARDRVRASTLLTSTASAYYVERPAPPSSPSLVQAALPFRRKTIGPVDRLQRPPPDISLPLGPTRSSPVSRPPSVDTARRQQANHAPETEHVYEFDRRHSPSAGAGARAPRLMSADELGAYREFLTRRAEDCVQDARSFMPPSPAPRSRGDDAASDFSWDAQSVAPSFKSGGRPTPRSHRASPAPPMSPAYPRGPGVHPTSPPGSHTAVQEDLMQALKAVRKQEDEVRDVDVRTVPEEHFARRGTPVHAPPHVGTPSPPRECSASQTDPLASPAQTVLSSLGDDDVEAMRDLLPDFLDLGVDEDTRHAPTASAGSRDLMWMLDEERVLSSVPEGAAAAHRPPPSTRNLYDDGDSSGWIGDDDDDYELADPILAPTPIPGSRPRKVHSQPDLMHPTSFLRPPLTKSNSHAGFSVNSHVVGFDSDNDVDPRYHGRVPLHLDTSVIGPGSRYHRHSPLERLQEDIAQLDPHDAPGYQSRISPRGHAHDFPTQVLFDREGRAYVPRRLARPQPQSDYEVAYEDADGKRIVYSRADRAFERRYDDLPATGERYAVRDRPPYSAREYTVRREHEHEDEHSPHPREYTLSLYGGSGVPASREPPHLDDERAPPARAYYPPPRPAARPRAHSGSSQREYVMYDDREYVEYRTRSADADGLFSPRRSRQSSENPSSASGDFNPRGAHPPERRAPPRPATLEASSRPDDHLGPSPARSSPPSQGSSEVKTARAPASTPQPAHSTSSFSTDVSDPKAKGSSASVAGDKSRPATPARKAPPPRRAYSPELLSLAASPMGFSGMSFRQARLKPKPKPKAKDKKSGPAGALHAAGMSEPNFKKSSTFSVSEEEVKSPRRGLFGKRKKA